MLLIEPTEGGRAFIGNEWLSELTRITVRELPEPKPTKKPKPKK
jgi:hypothetical protein